MTSTFHSAFVTLTADAHYDYGHAASNHASGAGMRRRKRKECRMRRSLTPFVHSLD
jgi:hypothetical protein